MASWFDWLAKCENVQWRSHVHVDCCWKVFKFVRAEPLKNKTGKSILKAFAKILNRGGLKTLFFVNGPWSRVLQQAFSKFTFLTAQNHETKSSITERMIRTLLSRIWRYFTFKDTERYVDVLPDFSRSYNATFHRSMKRSDHWWLSHNQPAIVQPIGQVHCSLQTNFLATCKIFSQRKCFCVRLFLESVYRCITLDKLLFQICVVALHFV